MNWSLSEKGKPINEDGVEWSDRNAWNYDFE